MGQMTRMEMARACSWWMGRLGFVGVLLGMRIGMGEKSVLVGVETVVAPEKVSSETAMAKHRL